MKNFFGRIKWTVLGLCAVQVLSCSKAIEPSEGSIGVQTSNDLTFPVTNEFADCKLRTIVHADPYIDEFPPVTGVFTYHNGNPISLVYNHGSGLNHYFFYDKLNRLREYQVTIAPHVVTEEPWHRYGYNSKNQIVVDTTLFLYGRKENGELIIGRMHVSTLTYDTLGRIIKESIRDVTGSNPVRNPTYTYDVRGNLGVLGWKSSSYDNKVSLFRSHPVFQFIHRNYSRNNAAPQPQYNSKGLPLSMTPSNDHFFNAYTYNGGVTKIYYDCK